MHLECSVCHVTGAFRVHQKVVTWVRIRHSSFEKIGVVYTLLIHLSDVGGVGHEECRVCSI